MHRLLARFLRELGLLDLLFQLGQLVATFLVAQLLLDRLHLFVEVVLALRLLHLALDARADALLDLQHGDLALHQAEHLLQPLRDRDGFEHGLLVGDLHREMRGDGVAELAVVLDLLDHADDFRRDLLVELHIAFELGHDRARERFGLDLVAHLVGEHDRARLVVVGALVVVLQDLGALRALDQHLHGAVGQLEQLQHAGERADLEDRVGRRIVVGGVLLRREQDERVALHHLFERLDRLLAPDEQRHDHVREDHDVAQRKNRVGARFAGSRCRPWLGGGHGLILVVVPLPRSPRMCSRREVPRTIPEAGGQTISRRTRRAIGNVPEPESNRRFSCTLGGRATGVCQVNPWKPAKIRPMWPARHDSRGLAVMPGRPPLPGQAEAAPSAARSERSA